MFQVRALAELPVGEPSTALGKRIDYRYPEYRTIMLRGSVKGLRAQGQDDLAATVEKS